MLITQGGSACKAGTEIASPQVNQNKEIKSCKLGAGKKIIVTMFVLHFDHGISAS